MTRVQPSKDTHLLVKEVHFFVGSTKGRKNYHITLSNRIKVFLTTINLFNKLNIHILQSVVDFGVVNKFVGDMNGLAFKVINSLVGQSNGSFHTPAKAEVLKDRERVRYESTMSVVSFNN